MPASFNGVAIFGVAVKFRTSAAERDTQYNAYYGQSGVEVMDGGARLQRTAVEGCLVGSDVATWSSLVALFRSYLDGNAYAMVDTKGRAWPNVRLIAFDEGEFMPCGTGYYSRYSAVFEHLQAT